MEDNGITLKTTNPDNQINSKSYIIIECKSDGDIIELRTDPPTLITLRVGRNILTIEKYPALKFGFKAHKEAESDSWGEIDYGITSFDFSNFDSSEMTSIEEMFCGMTINPEELNKLNTSNVISMNGAFDNSKFPQDTKLTFCTKNVEDMSYMFWQSHIESLDLSAFDVSKVKTFENMFSSLPKNLILDNWQISSKFDWRQAEGIGEIAWDYKTQISLKGCNLTTVKFILRGIGKDDFDKVNLILSDNIRYREDYPNPLIVYGTGKGNLNLSADGKTLVGIRRKTVNVVLVTQGVEKIADNAFDGCDNLHTVILPDTLVEIGDNAFKGCKKLTWINIPDSVKVIGSYAFDGCENLKDLYVGNGVETIGMDAFDNSGIKHLTFPLTVKDIEYHGIPGSEFIDTITLVVPKGKIDDERFFFDNEDLTWFHTIPNFNILYEPEDEYPYTHNGIYIDWTKWDEIPDKITGEYNEGPTTIIIPKNIIEIPKGIVYIGKNSLSPNRQCKFIYIPETVKAIHPEAFGKTDIKFVTKRTNLRHLLLILPEKLKGCDIYVI